MSISTPPQLPAEQPVQVAATPTKSDAGFLGGTSSVSSETNTTNNIDESTNAQNNQSSLVNQQYNTVFDRPEGEVLGGVNGVPIKLNQPLAFTAQYSTNNFNDHRFQLGAQWTPGRGKTARRILKKQEAQLEQQRIHRNYKAQMALETHCAGLASKGFTTQSCAQIGIVALAPQVQTNVTTEVVTGPQHGPDLHNHTAPEPVRGLY